jgi:Flp pilus assembly protein TadD
MRKNECHNHITMSAATTYEQARANYERGIRYWSEGSQQDALECFEAALELDPRVAELPYQEGLERARAGEIQDAEGWLWIAHLFRPEHAPTLSCLGDVLRRLGRVEEALPLLEQGAALAPESWEAQSDFGLALCEVDRVPEAAGAIERAVRLHGMDARLASNLAMVRRCEGRVEEALVLLDEAIAQQPDFAAAHVNRAHLLLLLGRFEEGWKEYEWRPQKRLSAERRLGKHDWAGKTVLLHQEQGAGDLIQFARYAAVLAQAGAEVTVSCDERFIPLMRCVKGVSDALSWNGQLPALDLEANVMSLPGILKMDFAALPVPYVELDPERVMAWKQRLGGERRLRVGLVWGGNPANPVERRRRISLAELGPVLRNPDVSFYSLQQGPQRADLAGAETVVDLAGE